MKNSLNKALEEAWLATYGKYDPGRDGVRMAKDFANALAPKLSDIIYDFVKEIGIQITPSTLVSPNGPVSGVILPTDVKVS